jgi:hypothetical protein
MRRRSTWLCARRVVFVRGDVRTSGERHMVDAASEATPSIRSPSLTNNRRGFEIVDHFTYCVPPLVRFRRRVVDSPRRWPAAIKPDGDTARLGYHPGVSLGIGLCQPQSEATIASASFGPQLRCL